jgi:PASTA domain
MAKQRLARVTIGLVGASALTLGLSACSNAEPTAVPVTEAASTSPSPASVVDSDGDGTVDSHDYAPTDPTVQRSEDVRPAEQSTAPASATPSGPAVVAPAPQPSTVKVPDVKGMNYQDAQDLLRANGLIVLPATDALGADRLALVDLNWYVVSQDIAPGSTVDAGSGITCTILKYTDR